MFIQNYSCFFPSALSYLRIDKVLLIRLFYCSIFKELVSPNASSSGYRIPLRVEAPPRLELGIRVLQTLALPLGYSAGIGADYEARTRYLHLGKVALYQMS